MPLIVCESLIQRTTPAMKVLSAERDDERVDVEQHDERAVDQADERARRRAPRGSTSPIDQPWLTFRIASVIAESAIVAATERS